MTDHCMDINTYTNHRPVYQYVYNVYVQMSACVGCVVTLKCVFTVQSLHLFLCSHHGLQQWKPQGLGGGQKL